MQLHKTPHTISLFGAKQSYEDGTITDFSGSSRPSRLPQADHATSIRFGVDVLVPA